MKKQPTNHTAERFAKLRQRAEEALSQEDAPQVDASLLDDVQRLITELQVHQIELEMQNDELRQMQLELAAERQRYADLYNFAPVAYFTLDDHDVVLELNLAGAELLGHERKYLINRPLTPYLTQDSLQTFIRHRQQVRKTQLPQTCELTIRSREGNQMQVQVRTSIIQPDTHTTQDPPRVLWRSVMMDITARKQAERALSEALAEKEILMQEIHHRVKNNLQVVTYFIAMQEDETQDPATRQLLQELQNRIESMRLVHEELYQTRDLTHINFGGYLRRLVVNLHQSFATASTQLEIETDDVFLDPDLAIPCGLIVTELVTNAFKYAFPKSKATPLDDKATPRNIISVTLQKDGEHIVLIVSDNGIGMPADLESDIQNTQDRGLGLRLVRGWATHQLGGTLDVDTKEGTTFTIKFKG